MNHKAEGLGEWSETTTSRQTTNNEHTNDLPALPLDFSDHKLVIFLNWFPIVLGAGILPPVLYFALHYGTSLSPMVCLTVPGALMGGMSYVAFIRRTWELARKSSECRPLFAQSRWTMDYFHWNFFVLLIGITVIVSVGIAKEKLEVASLPLSIVIVTVCTELLLARLAMAMGVPLPFTMSSLPRGSETRPATYIIAEDVVAVDGGLGARFRQAWSDRYVADDEFQTLLKNLDLFWGLGGVVLVAILWGVIFGVENKEVGFALGWILPWVWVGLETVLTIRMAKNMLRKQRVSRHRGL